MILNLILFKILKMKRYRNFIYRYSKNGHLIISSTAVDCALNICSPAGCIFYDEIEELEYANRK